MMHRERHAARWLSVVISSVAVLATAGCGQHVGDVTGPEGGAAWRGTPQGGSGGFPAPPPDGIAGFGGVGGCGLGVEGPGVLPPMATGGDFAPTPLTGDVVKASVAPPPISGGTLLVTANGKLLVASDPDRDAVYVIDATAHTLRWKIALLAGDEPGRLLEDAAGHVHVVLRSGKGIATLDVSAGTALSRTAVCDLPRGIAYDASNDVLHVACAEGKLVTLSASTLLVTRTVDLGRDLRDVALVAGKLFVTRFRSAEVLGLDAAGAISSRYTPPSLHTFEQTFQQTDACGSGTSSLSDVEQTPEVAWRTMPVPGHGLAMLHQRARLGEVQISQGGYGGGDCGSGIVQTALSLDVDKHGGEVFPSLNSLTLPVDMAADPDGLLVAVVAAGNWGSGMQQVSVFPLSSVQPQAPSAPVADGGTPMDPNVTPPFIPASAGAPGPAPITMGSCAFPQNSLDTAGQATAVAFITGYVLAVQTREPATVDFFDLRTSTLLTHLDLAQRSVADTGHEMFHLRAGAGVACASCHAEGGDDGHVWTFATIGPRRTQHLRGGILGTEPFHWDGDMSNFGKLMTEVFVGRMAGFTPTSEQQDALSHWVDVQPSLAATPSDAAAVQRGQALFTSAQVSCTSCHAGNKLTNNQNADVGTGAMLQVPSLRGVSFRAPFMHDGCAKTLTDRFGACGGGNAHGHTSQLSKAQIADLVAFLESL